MQDTEEPHFHAPISSRCACAWRAWLVCHGEEIISPNDRCHNVQFPGSSAATCTWFTDRQLVVTLAAGATVVPGDNITAFTDGTIAEDALGNLCEYHDCSCWPTANQTSGVVLRPDTPLVPTAVFVGMTSLGSCSSFELDATSSTGSGGRDWVTAEWTVNSTTLPQKNLTAPTVLTLAAGDGPTENGEYSEGDSWRGSMVDWVASYDGESSVEVPAPLLQAGHQYEFVLTLRNFLGFESMSDRWIVQVAAGAKPDVLISGGTVQSSRRPLSLTIFAEASVAVCPGEKAGSSALSYRWSSETLLRLTSSSRDPRFFKLPAYALNSTTTYAFSIVAIDAFGQNNTASVSIYIGESALAASIEGGNRIVSIEDTLALDASSSIDPDVYGKSGETAGLSFEWSCSVIDDSSGGACVSAGQLNNAEQIEFETALLGPGTFRFTAMAMAGARNATTSVDIEVRSRLRVLISSSHGRNQTHKRSSPPSAHLSFYAGRC